MFLVGNNMEVHMNQKGILEALGWTVGYPALIIFGLVMSIINYPVAIINALFDPNTP